MVKFSVIVPIYKVEKYLCFCLDSILAQTYGNFELILVDDGSPDKCPSICDHYASIDTRVCVIHKQNGGLVSARIAGAKHACGDYVVCVDGDDWVQPDYLSKLSMGIEKNNADIICCGYNWGTEKDLNSKKINLNYGFYTKKDIEEIIYPQLIESVKGVYFPPSVWAKAFQTDLYKKIQCQVDPRISIGEDHAVTKPCIYCANSCLILEDCLYNYRVNPSSMTRNKSVFSKEAPLLIGEHFEQLINMNEFDFQEQVYRNVVHNVFNVVMSEFNRPEPYKIIKREIKEYLKNQYIQNAIQNCWYKGSVKGLLAQISLKYKLFYLIKIYNNLFYNK